MSEYVLLDARANDDPDDAIVYVWCKSLADAIDYRQDFPDAVLARCDRPRLEVLPWPKRVPPCEKREVKP